MKAKIQEFAPKDLLRIIATASSTPGVHPDLADVVAMAEDTIAGFDGFTASAEQAAAARNTILALKEISACPSTKKP